MTGVEDKEWQVEPRTPDVVPVSLGDHIFAAARADMEFQNTLAALRHYLENLLAAFSYAVCSRDTGRLGQLIKGVSISLHGCPECHPGSPGPEQIISWFGHTAPIMRQTITNISVQYGQDSVLYSAVYQDWEAGPSPRCTALGTFQGKLTTGHQVWRWAEHTVTPANQNPACPHSLRSRNLLTTAEDGSRSNDLVFGTRTHAFMP